MVTDHRPLVKILGDRTLDEITNTRLIRLKQRTLPWAFDIIYRPGSTNNFADATSRHPSSLDEQNYDGMPSLMSSADLLEVKVVSSVKNNIKNFTIDWDEIVRATNSDNTLCQIRQAIEDGFPLNQKHLIVN